MLGRAVLASSPRSVREVTVGDVWEARQRLRPYGRPTPTMSLPETVARRGSTTVLKLEALSPVGSFKWRGAFNKMLSLPQDLLRGGVTAFSTGNHGIAVAYAARELGVPAFVCVPATVGRAKLERLRALGAGVDMSAADQDGAAQRCRELQEEHSLTLVEPFDDPEVIAGQGTVGLELLEEHPDLEAVIVPVSGGGLVSGIAMAIKANSPGTRVIGVGASAAGTMSSSLRAGRPVVVAERATLADSLLGGLGPANRYTFDLVQRLGVEMVEVGDDQIADAMRYLLLQAGLAVEGAAAVGIAALRSGLVNCGGVVAVVVTGRNVDPTAVSLGEGDAGRAGERRTL